MTKLSFSVRLLLYEGVGFFLLILFIWMDELLDLPQYFLGAPNTPINFLESAIETTVALLLATLVLVLTWRLCHKIRYLEGFLHVCSFCKRIRVDDKWIPLETYLHQNSAAEMSHGICPDCAQQHYGDLLK